MSVAARMAGIPEGGVGDNRLITALAMGRRNMQELASIANGAPPKDGVDSMYAVIAMNMLKTTKQAEQERQAQQPKQPTVKDQIVGEVSNAGLAALPQADTAMTEQGMAAGGIVAFDEGGEVDKYDQNGVRRYALGDVVTSSPLGRTFAGIFGPSEQEAITGPAYMAGITAYDARINQIASRLNALGGYIGTTQQTPAQRQEYEQLNKELVRLQGEKEALARNINRAYETKPSPISAPSASAYTNPPAPAPSAAPGPSAAPAPTDRTQQAPAGPQPYAPQTSFPGVNAAMSGLKKAYSAYENFDPMQGFVQFEAGPYERFLPQTAQDIRTQRGEAEAELRKMYPQTREEAEKLMADRYAGLEGMFQKREARAEEARKGAEQEKGQTAGLGLMQLASELVTKPLTRIDTSAAFQTFKEANKDYRQAQKEFQASQDKIDEARELQKIGQFEKADALYREGVRGVFDFKNQTEQLAAAQDNAYKSGLFNLAGKSAQAQADKLAKRVEMGKAEVDTALGLAQLSSAERRTAMQSQAEVDKYRMFAPGREAKTIDMIRDSAAAKYKDWLNSTEGKLAAIKPGVSEAMRLKLLREEYAANGYTPEQIAKVLGAPSGGGAQPVIDFVTGKPIGS